MKYLILGLALSFSVFAENAQLKKVFEGYEQLHASFFDFKKDQVLKSAKNLSKEIDKIKEEEIKKLLTYSKKKLDSMSEKDSRDDLNKTFNTVSMAFIHVMKTHNMEKSYGAYYCPMVQKKWIQNTDKMAKVHNPYAPEMPHCGGKE